jgi:hypothetical protein
MGSAKREIGGEAGMNGQTRGLLGRASPEASPSMDFSETPPVSSRRAEAVAAFVVLLTLVAVSLSAGQGPETGGARAHAPLVHAPFGARATTETSTNWSGYAVVGQNQGSPVNFTSVTGTWKQPKADCSTSDSDSAAAFWVGLGGYDEESDYLEQIGTDSDCERGVARYYAWYELIPAPPVMLSIKIRPGDVITTSVNVLGSTVTFQLKNRTRHTVFTKRVVPDGIDLTSAEWVAEAPSSCRRSACEPVPLANFGTHDFARIATIGNDHPGTLVDPAWTTVPIQLVPSSRGGFFPGPERGARVPTSTAGTTPPTNPSTDGRMFSLSWLAKA